MKMIASSHFLAVQTEADEGHKRQALAGFLKALERKSGNRVVRATGLTTMALSLAACGGSGGETTGTTPVDPNAPFSLSGAQLTGITSLRTAIDNVANFINTDIGALAVATNAGATPAVVDPVARIAATNAVGSLAEGANTVSTILAADALERLVLANREAIARDFSQILNIPLNDILATAGNIGTSVAAGLPRVSSLSPVENAIFDIIVAAQTNGEIIEAFLALVASNFPSLNLANLGTYTGPSIPVNATLSDLIAVAQASVAGFSTLAGTAITTINMALSSSGQTYVLTAGADNFSGTAGNDTFNSTTSTFGPNDTINGGAGNDTLVINQADPMAASAVNVGDAAFANVRNVETVRYDVSAATTKGTIVLGTSAAAAGINSVTLSGTGGNADVTAFIGNLTVTGNAGANTVAVSLASAGNKTLALGNASDALDRVSVTPVNATVGSVQVNFTSGSVGNGTNENVTIVGQNGTVIVNDEGTLISATNNASVFNVVGLGANGMPDPTQNRGNFAHIILGATGNDLLDVGAAQLNLTGAVYINAGGGNDTLIGGASDDFFVGGAGNDVITLTQGGNDSAIGGAGNDTITSGAGNDSLNAGDGDDVVDAGAGSNTIAGGLGNDTLSASSGNDSIDGGDGNDAITGGGGSDTIVGGIGDDTITALGVGTVSINAGEGNDRVIVDNLTVADTIDGGVGTDTVAVIPGMNVTSRPSSSFKVPSSATSIM